jgi:hypothetical protein
MHLSTRDFRVSQVRESKSSRDMGSKASRALVANIEPVPEGNA